MCEEEIAHIGWNGYFWITEKVGSNSLSIVNEKDIAQNRLDRYFLYMEKSGSNSLSVVSFSRCILVFFDLRTEVFNDVTIVFFIAFLNYSGII